MLTRRLVWSAAALVPALASTRSALGDDCAVFTKSRQQALSPADSLRLLQQGNERFVAGRTARCDLMAQVRATSSSQAPHAAVVGCIDSRVPPELVFDQRIGDVFVARIAGNFVNPDILGSLEFATRLAGARSIVVLGHNECGAVKGAIDQAKIGHLTRMLTHFTPAIEACSAVPGERSSKNADLVQAVATMHARLTARQLVEQSDVLRELVSRGELLVAAAMHDLHSGKVTFLS